MKDPIHRPEVATDQERRRVFLQRISLAWLTFGIVCVVLFPFVPQERPEVTFLIALIFPTYLITLILNRFKRPRLAGAVFTIAVNFSFYSLFIVTVGQLGAYKAFETEASVLMLIGLAVLFAGALVDKRAAMVVAAVNSVLVVATRLTIAPDSQGRPSLLVFYWLSAVIIWLYEGTLHNALERSRAEVMARKRSEEDLKRSNNELFVAYDATIEGWSRAMDLRDKDTEGHTERVTEMTVNLARRMGFKDEELIDIRRGGLLHDIGKLGVPDSILYKSGDLTEEEWVLMRKHPALAYDMLSSISYLEPALMIPYCHHEKWDGTGYPRGLKGEQIPLAARIFAIVDVWDALTSDRPYRPAWSREKALEYIKEQAGTFFDPEIVDPFLVMIEGAKR